MRLLGPFLSSLLFPSLLFFPCLPFSLSFLLPLLVPPPSLPSPPLPPSSFLPIPSPSTSFLLLNFFPPPSNHLLSFASPPLAIRGEQYGGWSDFLSKAPVYSAQLCQVRMQPHTHMYACIWMHSRMYAQTRYGRTWLPVGCLIPKMNCLLYSSSHTTIPSFSP